MSDDKTIRIYSWNVNGFRAALRKGFMDWHEKSGGDIFCLQETRAPFSAFPPEFVSSEDVHFKLSEAEKKGYSGVATISRVKPEGFSAGLSEARFDNEGRVVKADFGDFVLYNIYFPNGTSKPERLQYKLDFYDRFLEVAISDISNGKEVIVCGDVNTAHKEIDLARPKQNVKNSGFLPEERAWIDKLLDSGFNDSLRLFTDAPELYTWWDQKTRARDRNIGWRIDYFFVSEGIKDRVVNAQIHADVMGSDHCPISIDLKMN